MHFGHCREFAIVIVDDETKAISGVENLTPPAHEPGVLPKWLKEQGATLIISGGMGQRAQMLFADMGIDVLAGAPSEAPEDLVRSWLDGTLECGGNVCDH